MHRRGHSPGYMAQDVPHRVNANHSVCGTSLLSGTRVADNHRRQQTTTDEMDSPAVDDSSPSHVGTFLIISKVVS
ncbi:hypothetical protein NHX12_013575 [Muraenolepis orangiensis]|uniref:Uncharacterized protein n=1 Tax=Muraenolepis orangiensis TaxID=630683 RepID=A0A9Q0DDU9_9TELE|nr:hypothetical protein NHX12_013575 [Muraenolepis orangiensis]